MSKKIKLVQGDTRPYIRLTLRDADGQPINVRDAVVRLKFRALDTTNTLFTVQAIKPQDGTDGVVVFGFPPGALNIDPDVYEGEIEIDFGGGDVQTVYDTLKFTVRAQFN
jgi:hypothetical protein